MMSAAAASLAPLGIFKGIFYVFLFSDSAGNCASAESCVDVGCSVDLEVATETDERQR